MIRQWSAAASLRTTNRTRCDGDEVKILLANFAACGLSLSATHKAQICRVLRAQAQSTHPHSCDQLLQLLRCGKRPFDKAERWGVVEGESRSLQCLENREPVKASSEDKGLLITRARPLSSRQRPLSSCLAFVAYGECDRRQSSDGVVEVEVMEAGEGVFQ